MLAPGSETDRERYIDCWRKAISKDLIIIPQLCSTLHTAVQGLSDQELTTEHFTPFWHLTNP